MRWGREIEERLNALAKFSELGEGVTRRYLTKEHESANELIKSWMKQAGMTIHIDAVGNVVGRYQSKNKQAKTIIIGSHQDTVICGGRYDGAMGIVLPLVALEQSMQKDELDYNIVLIAFGDEEGVRFSTTYLGSKAVSGRFETSLLEKVDSEGISLGKALEAFKRDETLIERCKIEGDAYLEVHIEQGPVLESKALPVGIVSSIQSSRRYTVHINGKAGHAGTVPMSLRRDAGRRSSKLVCDLLEKAEQTEGVVATVGKMAFYPGAENVIPSKATFTIDIRSPYPNRIDEVMDTFKKMLEIGDEIIQTNHVAPTTCDTGIMHWLEEGIKASGIEVMSLSSGAGHDGQEMSEVMPVGMLFVRCKEGLSHHPDEYVSVDDLDKAAEVIYNCFTL